MKRSQQQDTNYEFDVGHRCRGYFVQRPLKSVEQMALVVLRRNLSENKDSEDAIPGGHPETNTCHTNLSLDLLSLFISWNYLLSLFIAEGATLEIYKEFYWQVWVKCEPRLLPHIRFYAKNMCQMRKTRIEFKADLAASADARETARLEVEDGRDDLSDVVDNNGEAEIDSPNVGLVEFGIQTQMSLADSVRKTRCKEAIDDLTEGRYNNLITSLIINIGAEISKYMEDSLTIRRCQVDEFDHPSINNIDRVSIDVVASWQKIIYCSGQPAAINADIEDSNSNLIHQVIIVLPQGF